MGSELRERAGREALRVAVAPEQPKQMDVGDRVGVADGPRAGEPELGERVDGLRALWTAAARGVQGRRDERHPRDHVRLRVEIVWPELGLRIAPCEVEQDCGHLA